MRRAFDASVATAVKLKEEGHAVRYVFAGDLLTNDPTLDLAFRCVGQARWVARALHAGGIDSYWVAGNHDVFEDGYGTTALDLLHQCAPGVTVCSRPGWYEDGELLLLPFPTSAKKYDPAYVCESNAEEFGESTRIVVGHLGIEGIGAGSETTDFPRGRDDVFLPLEQLFGRYKNARVFNGHYHKRQVHRSPWGSVQVIGSLVNLTRAEIGNPQGHLVVGV